MISHSTWIFGASRSGKTARLVDIFSDWLQSENHVWASFYTKKSEALKGGAIEPDSHLQKTAPRVLVLAANSENRRELADKIVTATQGKYPVRAKTMLGFFQDEVILFWPLLIQSLNLKAQFPVRLRPETEQELATKLWHSQLDTAILRRAGVNESRLVRRILDLFQLAAYSGIICEDISRILQTGLPENAIDLEPEFLVSLLLDWRDWCLERGLLSYGIITELYSQKLLSDRHYQQQLTQRYHAVLADDVDEYPAVARQLFDFLLNQGAVGAFSYNPDGAVRLGLGADPQYLEGLAERCQTETLTTSPLPSLAEQLLTPMVELVTESMMLSSLPNSVQLIPTTSRAQLLRKTADEIAKAINSGQVQAEDVAIIAPGLDAIARYTLVEILSKQNIPVESLNEQRPLISSPVIRALLTMLALVYPGLGRLVDREAVAEMLVIFSRKPELSTLHTPLSTPHSPLPIPHSQFPTRIDPVRAGLITDYCFKPHPDHPHLLPVSAFERWDRIGYAATTAYGEILQWLEKQQAKDVIPSPTSLLYLAMQDFICKDYHPPYEEMAALRELLETAQHYWEIDTRLKQITPRTAGGELHTTISEFIHLLRRGTITANPYPLRPIGAARKPVTLATIFQYRSSRRFHRWHFWLDAGSPLWTKGGAATLFAAPLFLRDRLGEPWTAADENLLEEARLRKILADLLSRVGEKVYLCHSDLAVNGQEQIGHLLPLVQSFV
ncbi:recombinase family protein [Nodularia spumigena CS-586/05]|uniref:recombinase family protein n=1 Tax=Nodularia spumigena TaxID=70799 RepID=UPI00232EE177|nr:recombinase family protein [Nodularia spumigena]MDB9345823.1 recombinase family protein [Nodularia spumigena CS-588/06]MDB9369225.1 recombinase family protein [Nodularia spumigena CS-586/05]